MFSAKFTIGLDVGTWRVSLKPRGDTEGHVSEFPWERRYRVSDMGNVLTPALVVYPEVVASNIARTLHLLGGNAESLAGAHSDRKAGLHSRHAGERGVRISNVQPRSNSC
jgi:hypothetical protein